MTFNAYFNGTKWYWVSGPVQSDTTFDSEEEARTDWAAYVESNS